jgi:20S proteasome subunit alpha 1
VIGGGVKESSFEQRLTVFSTQGRLYQVEFAQEAALSGPDVVSLRTERACVVATRRRRLSPLIDLSSSHQIYPITRDVGCAVSGVAGDELHQVARMRDHAINFRRRYGHEVSARALALHMADLAQQATQEAPVRPLGTTVLVIGPDSSNVQSLFRIDPTGQFYSCHAVCVGQHHERATSLLHANQFVDTQAKQQHSNAVLRKVELIDQNLKQCLVKNVLKCLLEGEDEPDVERLVDEFELGISCSDGGFQILSSSEIRSELRCLLALH